MNMMIEVGKNVTTNNLLLIGDVHCKIDKYKEIVDNHNGKSIQLGDFGFRDEHLWHLKNIDSKQHKILFGNHDDYNFLNEKHSLGNYIYFKKYNLMSIRGAYSIDHYWRREGVDWFRNEELSYMEMYKAVKLFCKVKPRIVISHDCPQDIRFKLFGICERSGTSMGLQHMLNMHKPNMWIFAHHHESINKTINDVNYICLSVLETLII